MGPREDREAEQRAGEAVTTEAVYRCKQCHRRITAGEYENDVCGNCGEVGVYVEYHHVFTGDDEE